MGGSEYGWTTTGWEGKEDGKGKTPDVITDLITTTTPAPTTAPATYG